MKVHYGVVIIHILVHCIEDVTAEEVGGSGCTRAADGHTSIHTDGALQQSYSLEQVLMTNFV